MISTYLKLIANNWSWDWKHLAGMGLHALKLGLVNMETKAEFSRHYGDLNRERDLRPYRLMNPGSEGGAIIGDVVYFATKTPVTGNVLFAGDRNSVKVVWGKYFRQEQMVTCGIHHMDHFWNFDELPPPDLSQRRFELIISQAMLEHIVDPFGHVKHLAGLLEAGGIMVLHSVIPGFFYHRVPIDCCRFYPDWFEAVAKRLGLEVLEKQISAFNITYRMRKPS